MLFSMYILLRDPFRDCFCHAVMIREAASAGRFLESYVEIYGIFQGRGGDDMVVIVLIMMKQIVHT